MAAPQIVRRFVLDVLDDLSNVRHMATEAQISWAAVDRVAASLGVTDAARLKWRQEGRGVPATWRIRIASALADAGERIDLASFDALPVTPGRIAA